MIFYAKNPNCSLPSSWFGLILVCWIFCTRWILTTQSLNHFYANYVTIARSRTTISISSVARLMLLSRLSILSKTTVRNFRFQSKLSTRPAFWKFGKSCARLLRLRARMPKFFFILTLRLYHKPWSVVLDSVLDYSLRFATMQLMRFQLSSTRVHLIRYGLVDKLVTITVSKQFVIPPRMTCQRRPKVLRERFLFARV